MMNDLSILPEKFFEVLKFEGIVSITSWGEGEPHVVNTWNSYLVVTEDGRVLIPAYGFRKTQKNVNVNQNVIISLGSKEVMGFKDYQGTGFIIYGTTQFYEEGSEYDMMKEKFSFLNRVMEISVTSCKQKI